MSATTILDADNVTEDVKLLLRKCRLPTPQLLGMLKTEALDPDNLLNPGKREYGETGA